VCVCVCVCARARVSACVMLCDLCLREEGRGSKTTDIIQSTHDELGADSGLQAQRARRARHLRRRRLSTRARQGIRGSGLGVLTDIRAQHVSETSG
jgi:hypothetical protein